jgi:hypothetical protein
VLFAQIRHNFLLLRSEVLSSSREGISEILHKITVAGLLFNAPCPPRWRVKIVAPICFLRQ